MNGAESFSAWYMRLVRDELVLEVGVSGLLVPADVSEGVVGLIGLTLLIED